MDTSEQSFNGRGGRGLGGFEGRGQRNSGRVRPAPDSLSSSVIRRDDRFSNRGSFNGAPLLPSFLNPALRFGLFHSE